MNNLERWRRRYMETPNVVYLDDRLHVWHQRRPMDLSAACFLDAHLSDERAPRAVIVLSHRFYAFAAIA